MMEMLIVVSDIISWLKKIEIYLTQNYLLMTKQKTQNKKRKAIITTRSIRFSSNL